MGKFNWFIVFGLLTLGINAQDCLQGTAKKELDINNVRTTMLNGGDMFWDQGGTGSARYEIPKNSGKHSLFSGALWIAGLDANNNVKGSFETYRQGSQAYFPGPVVDTNEILSSSSDCLEWDRIAKVNKSTIERFISDFNSGYINTEESVPAEIKTWPGRNNPFLVQDISHLNTELAPFVDVDNDGTYNPMNGDYPDIIGHQSLWWVINDVGGNKTFSPSDTINHGIGLEVQVEAFAFKTDDHLNNTVFQKYTLIHKGNVALKDAYVGFYIDVDLGFYADDRIQCDVDRGMGIGYNGDDYDNDEGLDTIYASQSQTYLLNICGPEVDSISDTIIGTIEVNPERHFAYGNEVPAVGVDFVKGIQADDNDGIDNDFDGEIDEEGELLQMSTFMSYYNCMDEVYGNPTTAESYYNYLQGNWANGTPISADGRLGIDSSYLSTTYMFPNGTDSLGRGIGGKVGDLKSDSLYDNWTEESAKVRKGDRRFVISMGPFSFSPGDKKEFVVAFPWAQSLQGAQDAVAKLKEADDQIQNACDNGFQGYPTPLGLDQNLTKAGLVKVRPTVVEDYLFMEVPSPYQYEFGIVDLHGRIMKQISSQGDQRINASDLPSGIYFYRFIQNGKSQSGKFIKN